MLLDNGKLEADNLARANAEAHANACFFWNAYDWFSWHFVSYVFVVQAFPAELN